MCFSLIICTYKRPVPLLNLLQSVQKQTVYPNEILIIDGSPDDETQKVCQENSFQNLIYHKVSPEQRGLTRQRNFGISKLATDVEIVCFLDDDTILEPSYFEEVLSAFQSNTKVVGVGGVAINENRWVKKDVNKYYNQYKYFEFEGYVYPEGDRNVLRNILGLQSNFGPGRMPEFSNGRTCGFPLNGNIHEVDLLIGMSFSFRKSVFENIKFSNYFEGYGLYEDADFSIRALKYGINTITTRAQLSHFHDPSGRPNQFQYGKMVVRNGWYVWRVKYPKPSINARLKWNLIVWLLTFIRFSNTFTTSNRKAAFTESLGRATGWLSLLYNKPKRED